MKKYRVVKENARFCGNSCATSYRLTHETSTGYMLKKLRTGYRTDIEAMVEHVLISMDIPYSFEYKIGKYNVDFAFPSIHVILECDGWHHTTEKGQAHDAKRDMALIAKGWHVIHLEDFAIRHDAPTLVSTALAPYLPNEFC